MAFNARSYFAGVATVVGTMALGFGGGIMMTHAMIGGRDAATNHLERRLADNDGAPTTVVAPSPYRDDINARANAAVSPAESPGASTAVTQPESNTQSSAADPSSQASATDDKSAPATTAVATEGNGRPIVADTVKPNTQAMASDNNAVGSVKTGADARSHDGDVKKVSDKQRMDRQRRQSASRIKRQQDMDELEATAETVRQLAPEPAQDIEVKSSPFGLFN